MFEKFLSSNSRDFHQRYRGTFGYFLQKDKRILSKLMEVDSDNGVVSFVDRHGTRYQLNQDASEDIGFEFLPPVAAWHNTSEGPMLVSRVAQRQYSRGISDANTSIHAVSMAQLRVSFETLSAIFESKITAKEEADKGRSFAVAPQFAVSQSQVLLYSIAIGTCAKDSTGTYQVKLKDAELFGVELTDAFRRSNIKAVIQ